MNLKKVPKTDSIKELADFWDKHDITEYESNFEEIPDAVFEKQQENQIYIKLDYKEFEKLEKIASGKGISDE